VRWKRVSLPVPNVAVKKLRDYLTVSDFVAVVVVATLHKSITVHLPEVPAISALCKRAAKYSSEIKKYKKHYLF